MRQSFIVVRRILLPINFTRHFVQILIYDNMCVLVLVCNGCNYFTDRALAIFVDGRKVSEVNGVLPIDWV